ncbi:MAG: hypothetical protein V2A64_02055 [Candidatus Omnitrophota bacterium]
MKFRNIMIPILILGVVASFIFLNLFAESEGEDAAIKSIMDSFFSYVEFKNTAKLSKLVADEVKVERDGVSMNKTKDDFLKRYQVLFDKYANISIKNIQLGQISYEGAIADIGISYEFIGYDLTLNQKVQYSIRRILSFTKIDDSWKICGDKIEQYSQKDVSG